MPTPQLSESTLKFLKALEKNNNRDWFNKNKSRYQAEHDHFKLFASALLDKMSHHDQIEKLSTHRIYRDVRFSKDKSPYKSQFSLSFSRATKLLRGGYYLHIEPGNSFAGGGFWAPNTDDLRRIRQEIASGDKPLRKIINSAAFKKTFVSLQGDAVKTAPQGFSKDHPAIDLLRLKQFLVMHPFTDAEVVSPKFLDDVNKTFKSMRPFFDYMSEVLTTDANGVPIVE